MDTEDTPATESSASGALRRATGLVLGVFALLVLVVFTLGYAYYIEESKPDERRLLLITGGMALSAIVGAAALTLFSVVRLHHAHRREQDRLADDRQRLAVMYRSLAQHANDAILLVTAGGEVVEANERAAELYGLPIDRLVGEHVLLLHAPEVRWEVAGYQERIASADGRLFETVHVRADGTRLPVEVSARLVDIGGKRLVLAIVRDIAERKRTEEALVERLAAEALLCRASTALLKSPLEELDREIYRTIESLGELLGATRAALARIEGETLEYVHVWSSDAAAATAAGKVPLDRFPWWAEVIRSGETIRVCCREDLPAEAAAEREWYENAGIHSVLGVPLGMLRSGMWGLSITSVVDNRRWTAAEEQLTRTVGEILITALARREYEQDLHTLRRAIEQSPSSVLITDRDAVIEYVNPQFCRSTGYSPEEVLGKNPRLLQSGSTPPDTYVELWDTVTRGATWRGEFVNRRKNGEIFLEQASIAGVIDAAGAITHYVCIKEDITGKRRLEDERRQAQKMEAVGRLAGGVAHDFNNVLTAILGHCFLVEIEVPENERAVQSVQEIRRAAERASRLTQQLQVFSRKQSMQPEVLDLGRVLADLRRSIEQVLPEDIELTVELAACPTPITADPGQIAEALLNLALNARDAMPHGGGLKLATSLTELDDASARAHGFAGAGAYVSLAVSDTGRGMPPDVLARCFEPFFTTKSPREGTGLGLSTVYGIVKQSGAEIAVESALGRGTRFEILFPRAPGGDALAAPASGSESVLVVEDNTAVRTLIRQTLLAHGYRVAEATQGEHALALCSTLDAPPDLLLTDVVMPGMSGRELAAHVTSLHRDTRVLYISGHTADQVVQHGVLDAGPQFLQKPFTPETLLARVREILDSAS